MNNLVKSLFLATLAFALVDAAPRMRSEMRQTVIDSEIVHLLCAELKTIAEMNKINISKTEYPKFLTLCLHLENNSQNIPHEVMSEGMREGLTILDCLRDKVNKSYYQSTRSKLAEYYENNVAGQVTRSTRACGGSFISPIVSNNNCCQPPVINPNCCPCPTVINNQCCPPPCPVQVCCDSAPCIIGGIICTSIDGTFQQLGNNFVVVDATPVGSDTLCLRVCLLSPLNGCLVPVVTSTESEPSLRPRLFGMPTNNCFTIGGVVPGSVVHFQVAQAT